MSAHLVARVGRVAELLRLASAAAEGASVQNGSTLELRHARSYGYITAICDVASDELRAIVAESRDDCVSATRRGQL